MLSPEQVAAFQRDGCILGGPVLSPAEVEELRADLDAVIAGTATREPVRLSNLSGDAEHPVWQVVNICDASDAFMRLVHNAKVVEMAAQLIGASALRLWHDQIQYKPPRHGGTNGWHQDAPFWAVLGADSMVSAWIPLDDADESNGCMSMVPRSHRWGRRWHDYLHTVAGFDGIGKGWTPPDGKPFEVKLWPVPCGTVSFHHCLTWHASHGNRSERPRRAIALHYMDGATPFIEAGDHIMKAFVTSRDGEPMAGERFPVVYADGGAA
ncbi:MAG: phytanoyl-CoA dioxygenase family protein [Armatimonadetes bacterium]|nr:phytanoyl-CoA dioxygenase family protein [Armatimonadota bacterium]